MGVITFIDGTTSLSSLFISKGKDAAGVEEWVAENYTDGKVIMDDYRRPISPVNVPIPMNNYINVGTKPFWEQSLENPARHADWIIVQKADTDAFWNNLERKDILRDHFSVVHNTGNIWVYKKKTASDEYIVKQGQNLVLKGELFQFFGANVYDLLSQTNEEVNDTFLAAKNNGINVIRFWGFNKESGLDEENFKQFDYILEKSKEHGIKLIVVLGNQWDDYGGMEHFSGSKSASDFYTKKASITNFKNHVGNVINHTNNLSNIAYKDDPTIMAWELINEPRIEGVSSSEAIINWTEEMAEYVAYHDSNHLISVGTEGFVDDGKSLPYSENHGSNFEEICNVASIDICSVHLYPKYFKTHPIQQKEIDDLVERWQNITESVNKPFYIGEIGYDAKNPVKTNRQTFFNDVAQVARRKNISGALLWNFSLYEVGSFSVNPNIFWDKAVLEAWNPTQK